MSSGSKNKLWKLKTDFITHPEFLNTLPSAPCGPYFLDNTFTPSFEKYAEYKTSTLEKAYIWQPHLIEAGVKLDLVDPESVLIPNKVPPLHPMDAKYLQTTVTTTSTNSIRNKKRKVSNDEKPWWLRNTVYLENNLYNQRRPAIKEEVTTTTDIMIKNPFSTSFILESFDYIKNEELYHSTLKKFKSNCTINDIEWSIPILPDVLLTPSLYPTLSDRTPTIQRSATEEPPIPVRFDEDITKLISQKTSVIIDSTTTGGTGCVGGLGLGAGVGQLLDAKRSIITNTRRSDKGAIVINENSLNISLVAPPLTTTHTHTTTSNTIISNTTPTTSKPAKSSLTVELFGDDDEEEEEVGKEVEVAEKQGMDGDESKGMVEKEGMAEDEKEGGIPYKWVSDFKMEISKSKANDEYLLRIITPPTTTTTTEEEEARAEYWPVRSRIELKRLPVEEWRVCETTVHRADV